LIKHFDPKSKISTFLVFEYKYFFFLFEMKKQLTRQSNHTTPRVTVTTNLRDLIKMKKDNSNVEDNLEKGNDESLNDTTTNQLKNLIKNSNDMSKENIVANLLMILNDTKVHTQESDVLRKVSKELNYGKREFRKLREAYYEALDNVEKFHSHYHRVDDEKIRLEKKLETANNKVKISDVKIRLLNDELKKLNAHEKVILGIITQLETTLDLYVENLPESNTFASEMESLLNSLEEQVSQISGVDK